MPNIIDIGFDWKKAEADKDKILAAMTELLNVGQSLKKIPISFGSGIQEFKKLNDEVKKLSTDVAKAVDLMNKALKSNADQYKNSAQATALQAKALKDSTQASLNEAKAKTEAAKADQIKQKSSESGVKQAATEQRMVAEMYNDYKQLSKAYTEAADRAKNLALVHGSLEHPAVQQAIKDAKDMHDVLLRVDQAVGQDGRNIGNYKSHWDGLGMSVAQISRELPSLTISVQQFALAISNNIPMMADEIARAKVEIEAMKAAGQDAPSLFKRIGGAILSWQVGLSVGIALITAFAGKIAEMVEGWFDASSAVKRHEEQLKTLNQRQKEVLETQRELFDLLYKQDTVETTNLKMKLNALNAENKAKADILLTEKLLAEQRLKDATFAVAPDANMIDVVDPSGQKRLNSLHTNLERAGKEYENFIKKISSQATPVTESQQRTKDALQSSYDLAKVKYNEQLQLVDNFNKAKEDKQKADLEFTTYLEAERRKLLLESTRIEVSLNEDKNNRTIADDRKNLYEKIQAIRDNQKERIKLLEAEKNDVLNSPSSSENDKVLAVRTANAETVKVNRETQKLIFDIKQEWDNKRINAIQERNKIELEQEAKFQEEFAQNENASFQSRAEALNKFSEDQKQLIEDEYQQNLYLLNQKAHTKEEEVLLEAEKDVKLIQLTADTYKKIQELTKSHFAKQKELQQNELNKISGLTTIDIGNLELYAADLKGLNKLLADKKISLQKYHNERKKIEEEYDIESLQSQIQKEKQLIEAKRALGQSTLDDEKRLAELQIQLDDKVTNKKLLNRKKIRDAERQLAEEIINLFQTIVDAGYERELNAIQERSDKSNEYYAKEIENVRNSTLSEQDKANRTLLLQAEQKAQQDKFDKEKRQAQERQAKFDRAIAVANILAHTAEGVTAALASVPPNVPLSILIGAIGAVQIASVLAKPIPKYAKGAGINGQPSHAGGYALLGDGGQHELVQTPSGDSFLSPNTDTLFNLPQGTRVTPIADDVLNEAMNNGLIRSTAAMLSSSRQAEKRQNQTKDLTVWQTQQLVKAMQKNRPIVKTKGVSDNTIQLQIEKNKWRYS